MSKAITSKVTSKATAQVTFKAIASKGASKVTPKVTSKAITSKISSYRVRTVVAMFRTLARTIFCLCGSLSCSVRGRYCLV